MTRRDDRPSMPVRDRAGGHLRRVWALLLAGMFFAAGCGSASALGDGAAHEKSGIVGNTVTFVCGGTSAVGSGCRHRPVAATVVVTRMSSRRRVATVRTDARGRFRLDLPAGTYRLQGQTSGFELWARVVTTRVRPRRVTRATLTFIPRHPLPATSGAASG
jgi:hypothetical protein